MTESPYGVASLKRTAWQLLTGRAISAVMSLVILLLLVRQLSLTEYGAYVTLIAGMELVIALAMAGLPWVAARYLPEFRLRASWSRLAVLTWRLLAAEAAILAVLAACAVLGIEQYLTWTRLESYRHAALIYLVVLFVEGTGRYCQDGLLGSLMQQGALRLSLILRQSAFLTILAAQALHGSVNLVYVAQAELAASALGTLTATLGLARYLRSLQGMAGEAGWREPRLAAMWRTWLSMYMANLLSYSYSPQVFLQLLQRTIGTEAAAVFGFVRNLHEQVARYLPATLLFGLLRPKLVASYVGGGGIEELARNSNLAGKLSLFVLMPIVAFAAVGSENLIGLLSGGKLAHTGLLFFGFMLVLVPISQRQILETIAVASGHSALCIGAAASGLLVLPLMWLLLRAGMGAWAGVAALGAGHLLFGVVMVVTLQRRTGYIPDYAGFIKLAASAAAGALGAFLVPTLSSAWLDIGQKMVLAAVAFLLAALLVKPFTSGERARLNALLGRRLIIW